MGLIYVDTRFLIYLSESHPQWRTKVASVIAGATAETLYLSPDQV